MIIVGYKTIPDLLGAVDAYECPQCINHVNWQLLIIEKYFSLFYLPVFPMGKAYSLICENCHYKESLNKTDFGYYKARYEIDLALTNNEITHDEGESKLVEINKIIEQRKAMKRAEAKEGSKEWIGLASKKTNEELLTICFHERYKYNPSFIIAVETEIEKRNLLKS